MCRVVALDAHICDQKDVVGSGVKALALQKTDHVLGERGVHEPQHNDRQHENLVKCFRFP